jgi:hypothetical protein
MAFAECEEYTTPRRVPENEKQAGFPENDKYPSPEARRGMWVGANGVEKLTLRL